MTQEPYIFKATKQIHWKPRGWSEAMHIQPQVCKEQQRVASVLLSKNATNIIVSSLKPTNIIISHTKENGIEVIAINMYFQPKYDVEEMVTILTETLSRLPQGIPILAAGDMNVRHTYWGDTKNTTRGMELLDYMLSQGFEVLNRQDLGFTFNSLSNRSSAVDIAFFRDPKNNLNASFKRRKEMISDHCILEVTLRKKSRKTQEEILNIPPRFNVKKADWALFQEYMQSRIELEDPLLIEDMNNTRLPIETDKRHQSTSLNLVPSPGLRNQSLPTMVSFLTNTMKEAAEKAIPKRKTVKNAQPWWTRQVNKLWKEKNLALIEWKRLKKPEHRRIAIRAEKCFKKELKKQQDLSWKEFVEDSSSFDVYGLYYKLIRRKISPPTALVHNPEYIGSIQDALRYQVETMFPRTEQESHCILPTAVSNQQDEPPFTLREVSLAINSIANSKAPGKDLLVIEMFKKAGESHLQALTFLYNKCLTEGIFPKEWKEAILAIVPKPGKTDMASVKSYRPVSLLCTHGKILDKMMTNRLNHFLESNKHLSSHQKGFRKRMSTIDAIEDAVNFAEIKRKVCHTLFVALDISQAFDTAKHDVICRQLNQVNCPRNLHKLIQSYLTNRSVTIRSGEHQYQHKLNQGNPQGGILSPSLWNLSYDTLIKKMSKRSKDDMSVNFICYADDALLQIRGTNVKAMEKLAQELLREVIVWGNETGLKFNATKTEVMLVHKWRSPVKDLDSFSFPVNETQLEEVKYCSNFKYLGVIIDEKLSFLQHLKNTRDKANAVTYDLCRVIKQDWGLDQEKAIFLYKSCIQPIILYGAEVWGNRMQTVQSNKHIIQSCQRKMLLRATRAYRTTPTLTLQVLCNTPPVWLLALMRYQMRQDVKTSMEFEDRTPARQFAHPSINPLDIVSFETRNETDIRNQSTIPLNETSHVGYITWIEKGNHVIGRFRVTQGHRQLVMRLLKFPPGIEIDQVSLFLTKELISSLRNVRQLVIHTKDRFLKSKLLNMDTDLLSNSLHQLLVTLKSTGAEVIISSLCCINETLRVSRTCQDMPLSSIPLGYNKKKIFWFKEKHNRYLIQRWQRIWDTGDSGRHGHPPVGRETYAWIPKVAVKSYNFGREVIQLLTNHGTFGQYLKRFKQLNNSICYCEQSESSAEHILYDCQEHRSNIIRSLVSRSSSWKQANINNTDVLHAMQELMRLHIVKARIHHDKIIAEELTEKPKTKRRLPAKTTIQKIHKPKPRKIVNASVKSKDIRLFLSHESKN